MDSCNFKFRFGLISCWLLLVSTISCTLQWIYTRSITLNAGKIESVNKINNINIYPTRNYTIEDYKQITAHVQQRFYDLQNPYDCKKARKVVCDTRTNGFGSEVHLLTICLTIGFMTNRTVIIESEQSQYSKTGWNGLLLPMSNNCTQLYNQTSQLVLSLFKSDDMPVIKVGYKSFYFDLQLILPHYIVDVVKCFHSDPQLWWAGQIANYILRPTQRVRNLIAKQKQDLGFQNVIVGLQVRRTDKLSEAYYYNLTDYMDIAEKWYNDYEKTSGYTKVKRRIFLATDVPDVVLEAKKSYPAYKFINDINATIAANKRETRFTFSSLSDIIVDIFLLSMCDYIVCTMTSNVCRLAYELMQSRHIDASTYAKSLDCDYYIQRLYKAHCKKQPTRVEQLMNITHNTFQ
ncbi:alpha-(1,6)-fucosyltransferase-like [Ruditapes philippinarum]|uniref:alpha-(1,6)-fucosyltransferase-like n=1 Tax=Ruditapes philippinarum TaxID=129788 RepID=UPI00295B4924|nr:alpha-(1,6)-fucosyltransferase-like [Ruditapes philippinarum]